MRLNKIQYFLFGICVILLSYTITRSRYIIGSEKVTGTFVFYVEENDSIEGNVTFPIIEYRLKDSVYQFRARVNSTYDLNEKVSVLLQKKDHDQPVLFDLFSFWILPLFYWVLPILIWSAFSLSYVNSNEHLIVSFKRPFLFKQKK